MLDKKIKYVSQLAIRHSDFSKNDKKNDAC